MKSVWPRALAASGLLVLAACSGPSGASKGEVEIWSSLPRQGSSKDATDTIVNAINMAIDQRGGSAGGYRIVYRDVDDSTAAAGGWDAATEIRNANDAVGSDKVVAYIGTYNAAAAKLSIPILCLKGIIMVSPANTGIGLTKPFEDGEPQKYYPQGCKRNYARVIPNDSVQGDAAARWASRLGLGRVYLLNDGEAFGAAIADVFEQNGPRYGVRVIRNDTVDTETADYEVLAERIETTEPDLVYYGGVGTSDAARLWRDLRDRMPDLALMGPDGILDPAFIEEAGDAAEGTYITSIGIPPHELTGSAAQFIERYETTYPKSPPVAYTAFGFEAADVVLGAIDEAARRDPPDIDALRSLVLDEVMATKERTGLFGNWSFDGAGDTTLDTIAGFLVKDGEIVFDTRID